MTTIETIAISIVAIISFPRICKFIRRPSLLNCSYLILGIVLSKYLTVNTRYMLDEAGKVGFTLLLFLIGLEIELPSGKAIKNCIVFCALWLGLQIPIVIIICKIFGYGIGFGWIAAASINACSLSIAYGLLKSQESLMSPESKSLILISMITLEVITLFNFAASDIIFRYGWGKEILLQSLALLAFITIIKLFSTRIHYGLSIVLEGKGKWRIHQMLLVILLVAIVGEKIGLSAPKTAFFLGLFMTAATRKGLKFEDELKPIAKGILIPVFFLSLGSHISVINFKALLLPTSIIVMVILIIRYFIFRHSFGPTLPAKFIFLFFPNITMASVAAEILIHNHYSQQEVDLLLMSSLILTIGSAMLFPIASKNTALSTEYSLKKHS